jgi:hypothetical protein
MRIVSYPRSGSTWLGYLLSECCDVPYVNKIEERGVKQSVLEPANSGKPEESAIKYVVRSHTEHVGEAPPEGDGRTIYLLRDGRDILVSYYFYRNFFVPERLPRLRRSLFHARRRLRGGFGKQFAGTVEEYVPKWKEHVVNWRGVVPEGHVVKYEDLIESPVDRLNQLLEALDISIPREKLVEAAEKHSFTTKSGREPGEEDVRSFKRKAISSDWKNHFDEGHKEIFKRHAGDLLVELGYERDLSW